MSLCANFFLFFLLWKTELHGLLGYIFEMSCLKLTEEEKEAMKRELLKLWEETTGKLWTNMPEDHSVSTLAEYMFNSVPELSKEEAISYVSSIGFTKNGKVNVMAHANYLRGTSGDILAEDVRNGRKSRKQVMVDTDMIKQLTDSNGIDIDKHGFIIKMNASELAKFDKIELTLYDQVKISQNEKKSIVFKYKKCRYFQLETTKKE